MKLKLYARSWILTSLLCVSCGHAPAIIGGVVGGTVGFFAGPLAGDAAQIGAELTSNLLEDNVKKDNERVDPDFEELP